MTFRQWAINYCFEHGMFEDQAKAAVEQMIADSANPESANEAMHGRWDDQVEGYPPQMLAVLRMATNNAACAWIDANCPQAWYRAAFDPAQFEALMAGKTNPLPPA